MARPPKELIEAILKSLRERPSDWSFSRHEAENVTAGVTVWVGNELYGMDVTVRDRNGSKCYGGVALGGALVPWRWRVYLAVERARRESGYIWPGSTATESALRKLSAAHG